MLGRGHAISGAVGYLAVAAPLGLPTDPQLLAAGTLLCAGAALAPDLDHPGSTLSRSGGAVTQTASGVVSAAAGGHRQLTHSLAFVAVSTVAATWLTWLGSPRPAAVVAGLLVVAAAPLLAASLGPTRLIGPALAGVVPAGWLGYAIDTHSIPLGSWYVVAIGLGVGLHLIGDLLTPQGVPLLAPVTRRRIAVPLFTTGSPVEALVTAVLTGTAVYLTAGHLHLT